MDESIFERLGRVTKERDEARAEVERLRKGWNESHDEVQRQKGLYHDLCAVAETRMKERDEARAEVDRLRRQPTTVIQQMTARPEPSRLEIAAHFAKSAWQNRQISEMRTSDQMRWALAQADALIAAAKEAK
jgi:hypothetical protein